MRRAWRLFLPVAALLAGACNNPSAPTTAFTVSGQWTTQTADSLNIRMTLSETARQVNGAGSWITSARVQAFRVTGARFEDEVSLLFEFGDAPAVTFQGTFGDTPGDSTLLNGNLFGGAFRGAGIIFVRRDD